MMKHNKVNQPLLIITNILLIVLISCTPREDGKIPITTSSNDARNYYFKGRDLFEKLRGQESLQFLEKAVAADSNFAMGYLFLSFSQPSAKGFFENLNKAVSLVGKVSEAERLWILGFEAGVNGFAMKQREYYKKLVATYPKDERAHNLLGNQYFGQQEWAKAIIHYNEAIEIAPNFSQPYNQLGYANRFLEHYTEAEKAFKKYIELIPDDPNPYDSYAELLMKMGRYDESIKSYKEALSINPNFVASHIGIATNLNFKDNHNDARKQLQKLYKIARNDGERRGAHFSITVSYVDEGNMDLALKELKKQYAFAEKINDAAAMAGDLVLMGNILLEAGKYAEAMEMFKKAIILVEESNLTEEVKNNNKRAYLFNTARFALKKNDYETAKVKSEEYHKQVEAIENPLQIKLSHQLAGMIALEEKDYDKALEELLQANQQNPYNLYRIALAYTGKGDIEKTKEYCEKVVKFNALNNLNYAFIRKKAQEFMDTI